MALVRAEDQMFFIYDHTVLKNEEDEMKDAIVYFFPSSIPPDTQFAVVGQLMGMVEFLKSFSASTPSVFSLNKNKVAILSLQKYSLALAGNRSNADSLVLGQLSSFHKLLVLFHGSLALLQQKNQGSSPKSKFQDIIQDVCDTYLPFVRCYGDTVMAAFQSVPFVHQHLTLGDNRAYLKAQHYLHSCQKKHEVISGCILYRDKILCSFLHPDLTSELLILKPRQIHFPCTFLKTDFNPPPDVRLLNIFLTKREYSSLLQNFPPNQEHYHTPNKDLKRNPSHPITDPVKIKREPKQTHSRRFGSVDWNSTMQEFQALAHSTVALGRSQNTEKAETAQVMKESSTAGPSQSRGEEAQRPTSLTISGITLQKSLSKSDIKGADDVSDNNTHQHENDEADLCNVECSNIQSGMVKVTANDEQTSLVNENIKDKNRDRDRDVPSHCITPDQTKEDFNIVEKSTKIMSVDSLSNKLPKQSMIRTSQKHCETKMKCVETDCTVTDVPNKPFEEYVQETSDITEEGSSSMEMSSVQLQDHASPSPVTKPAAHNISVLSDGTSPTSSSLAILRNIKRLAAQNRGILEDMTKTLDLHSDMCDSDDDRSTKYPSQQNHSAKYRISDPDKKFDNANSVSSRSEQDKTAHGSVSTLQVSSRKDAQRNQGHRDLSQGILTDMGKSLAQNVCSAKDIQNEDIMQCVCGMSVCVCSCGQQLSTEIPVTVDTNTNVNSHNSNTSENTSVTPSQNPHSEVHSHSQNCDTEIADEVLGDSGEALHVVDLYVHGAGDLVIALLLHHQQKKLHSGGFVNNLWRTCSSHLTELSKLLKEENPQNVSVGLSDYNHLMYDNSTRNLKGEISRGQGHSHPMSHQELDFCNTSALMHEEFSKSPNLTDITLRSHTSCVHSTRIHSSELYLQRRVCRPLQSIPTVRDESMCPDIQIYEDLLIS